MNEVTMEKEAATVLEQLSQAIDGMESEWPADQKSIVYQQVTYTPAQFTDKLKQALAPLQAVPDARSALQTAIKNRRPALPGALALVNGFYSILAQYLPPGADVTKFGAKVKKARKPLTAEEKTAANEKRTATRAARHIMGPKQRKAIKAPPTPPTPQTPPTPRRPPPRPGTEA
jgi:hypothetical protein